MHKRKIVLKLSAVAAVMILGCGTADKASAKATDKKAAEVAQRNFVNEPKEDNRVAIVMYVKEKSKNGVVYETEKPVKVFQYRFQAEKYIKAHENIRQYKRGLFEGKLRIRESRLWR